MWKEILYKYFKEQYTSVGLDPIIKDSDFIYYENNPKSGLNCWIRIDTNPQGKEVRFKNFISTILGKDISETNKIRVFVDTNITMLIISKDKEKALKAFKRFKPNSKFMFTTIVNHKFGKYYIIND